MGAIPMKFKPGSRTLERKGPKDKRSRNSRFEFDYGRAQPIDHAFIELKDEDPKTLILTIDFYSARNGWKTDGGDSERWEDEKLYGEAPATREGYRAAYRLARGLLKGRPMSDGDTVWLPIQYYGRQEA